MSITVITGIRSDSGNGVFLTVGFPTGGASFSFSLNQSSSISSYVTLRRAASASGMTVRLALHTPGNARPEVCLSGSHFNLPVGFVLLASFLPPPLPPNPPTPQERPKSALERLYSGDTAPRQRGKMSADEQLERMKRHQKALVRQRKRTLSHGDRHASPTPRAPSSSRPLSADLGSVCSSHSHA